MFVSNKCASFKFMRVDNAELPRVVQRPMASGGSWAASRSCRVVDGAARRTGARAHVVLKCGAQPPTSFARDAHAHRLCESGPAKRVLAEGLRAYYAVFFQR